MVHVSSKWGLDANDFRQKAKESPTARGYEQWLVLALVAEGKNGFETAEIIGKHYQTVLRWLDKYNDYGPDVIGFRKKRKGNPFLNSDQQLQLKEAVQHLPEIYGLEGIQWTYRQVIAYCSHEFGVLMQARTAQAYLHKLGFVRKFPKQRQQKATNEKNANSASI